MARGCFFFSSFQGHLDSSEETFVFALPLIIGFRSLPEVLIPRLVNMLKCDIADFDPYGIMHAPLMLID